MDFPGVVYRNGLGRRQTRVRMSTSVIRIILIGPACRQGLEDVAALDPILHEMQGAINTPCRQRLSPLHGIRVETHGLRSSQGGIVHGLARYSGLAPSRLVGGELPIQVSMIFRVRLSGFVQAKVGYVEPLGFLEPFGFLLCGHSPTCE